jgi:acetylornithine deacetylase
VTTSLPPLTVPAPRPRPRAADSRVDAALSAVRADELVGELQALLAVPSVTGTAAESELQHRLESRLRGVGMDTDLWSVDLPTVTADADFPGMEAPRDEAWGLVGAYGGDAGPTIVLNGHVDVVPRATRAGRSGLGRARSATGACSAAAPAT